MTLVRIVYCKCEYSGQTDGGPTKRGSVKICAKEMKTLSVEVREFMPLMPQTMPKIRSIKIF